MLKVNRIRVRLFTGMWLTEIDEFDMRTHSSTTIIIGRNGCGKSRLLGIIYPVCPNKLDFRDGGDYLNESEIDGVNFSFYCKRVGGSMKCTIKNMDTGVYLVKNVNPKVFNAKVNDILNIDPALVTLLTGMDDIELTRLTVGQRRHWFTRLSVSDLTYPLAVHKRLKDYSRDLVGAIKHGQMKIADIKPRVVECAKEREGLEKHIESLRVEVEELTASIRGVISDQTVTQELYVGTLDNLATVSNKLLQVDMSCNFSLLQIEQRIAQQQTAVGESRARYQHSQTALGEMMSKKQRQEYQLRNSAGLIAQIGTLEDYFVYKYESEFAFNKLFEFKEGSTQALTIAFNFLNEFSTDLTRAIDAITTSQPFSVLEKEYVAIGVAMRDTEENLRKVDNALTDLRHRLEHFLSVDSVDCPKCTTTFKPGLLAVDEPKLRKDIHDLVQVQKRGQSKLESLTMESEVIQNNYELRKQVRDIITAYSKDSILCIMFNRLHADDAIVGNRGKFAGIVSWFVSELVEAMEMSVEHSKLVELEDQLQAIKSAANIDDTDIEADIANIESVSRFQQDALELATSTLKGLESQRKSIIDMEQLKVTYDDLILKAGSQECSWMLNLYREKMSEKRKEVFDNYSIANSRFNEMDEEYRRLVAVEADVADLHKRQEVATLLVRAISPEKGLLRKHFYRAISRITDMMNKHINVVWQYHLQVLPCSIDDGDLDYKFPFIVGDNVEPAEDVRYGSAAQKEIFNLVFRLTAYKALGLEGYPLILDEPGHTFDEGHRDELVDFIKRLLGSEYSQAFIVSHNSDVHSRLTGADFVVISEDGVTPPAVYNERTVIRYRG